MKKTVGIVSLALFMGVIAVTSVAASKDDMFEQLKSKLVENYNQNIHNDSSQKSKYEVSTEKTIQGVTKSVNRKQQIQKLEDIRKINNGK